MGIQQEERNWSSRTSRMEKSFPSTDMDTDMDTGRHRQINRQR